MTNEQPKSIEPCFSLESHKREEFEKQQTHVKSVEPTYKINFSNITERLNSHMEIEKRKEKKETHIENVEKKVLPPYASPFLPYLLLFHFSFTGPHSPH
jgi:hypothetical protein